MTLLQEALQQAEKALAGDSNDAEHDALYALVEAVKASSDECKCDECNCDECQCYGGHDFGGNPEEI